MKLMFLVFVCQVTGCMLPIYFVSTGLFCAGVYESLIRISQPGASSSMVMMLTVD